MITRTSIVNTALGYCGLAKLNDIEDNTPEAATARLVWETAFRSFLSEHPWSFAVTTSLPARLSTAPWGWNYAFSAPIDMVSLLYVCDPYAVRRYRSHVPEGMRYPYAIMRVDDNQRPGICCNHEEIIAVYISDNVVVGQFSAKAVEALAVKMAGELSIVHKRNPGEYGELLQIYALRLQEAKGADRTSQSPQQLTTATYDDDRSIIHHDFRRE